MKTQLIQAIAIIALIAFVITLHTISAFAEAKTDFVHLKIDFRPVKLYSEDSLGIEIVPHKTENSERSKIRDGSIAMGFAGGKGTDLETIIAC